MADIVIRPAVQDDLEILWDFLAIAAYEPDAVAAKTMPSVAAYLAGWQRTQDFGFIAERDGVIIGATWARQFSPDDQKTVYGGERTPKLSIAVKPGARGRGVGEKLQGKVISNLPDSYAKAAVDGSWMMVYSIPSRYGRSFFQ